MTTIIDGTAGVTFPAGGVGNPASAVVGLTDTQTLTNKTLTSPVISSISNSGTITIPTGTDTLVGKATTDTLTNKTLASPTTTGASTFAAGSAAAPAITTSGDTNTGVFFPAADTIAFAEGGAEAMRIDSSGNLLVGTTTAGGKLSVSGNISVAGGDSAIYRVGGNEWTMVSSNGGYNTNGYHMKLDASTSAGQCQFFTIAAETIRFDGSGNASKSSGAGSWLSLSDKRIKENIVPVANGLERICLLKPSTFDYKQPNAHQGKTSDKGFIADDFVEVYPNSIVETDFIAEEDKQYFEEGSLAKSMGFNAEFYADLVAAIQEQQALITAQAETINALTARIVTLEGK